MDQVFGFASLEDMRRVTNAALSSEAFLRVPGRRIPRPPQKTAGMLCFVGKTAAGITKGNSGTINLYTGTASNALAVTSPLQTVTAYNRFADIASGKWVFVIRWPWGDEMFAAEC